MIPPRPLFIEEQSGRATCPGYFGLLALEEQFGDVQDWRPLTY